MARLLPPAVFVCLFSVLAAYPASAVDRLHHPEAKGGPEPGYRFERGGWTYVHLEGTPQEIGYQHGRLLAAEIADLIHVDQVELSHGTHRNWEFYRKAGRTILWPHIEAQYQQELEGIAKGAQSKGVKVDVWDIVALNGTI